MFQFSKRIVCLFFMLAMLPLSGCASKYGAQTTNVHYYPTCYRPVEQLRAEENSVAESTAGGAAVGAVLGALIGGLTTGSVEGAVIGGAVGGVSGGVAGHAYGTSQQKQRDAEFFRQYASQLDTETAQMSRANAAAQLAAKCYDQEFKAILANAQAGNISKIELTNRYEEIRAGLEETSRILQTTYSNMAEKDSQYQEIMSAEVKKPQAQQAQTTQQQAAQSKPSRADVQKATSSTQQWQRSRSELQATHKDIEAQIANNDRILDAALQASDFGKIYT